jgi:hypothetical protein
MNKDEALDLALEALETTGAKSSDQWQKERKAITAIKQATAQPAPVQEPITWLKTIETLGGFGKFVEAKPNEKGAKPVYLAPPAQPAPVQEPVAVTYKEVADTMNALWGGTLEQVQIAMELANKKLYTAPPAAQRQWVGLTDEEYFEIGQRHWVTSTKIELIHAEIEAKLKEKNT